MSRSREWLFLGQLPGDEGQREILENVKEQTNGGRCRRRTYTTGAIVRELIEQCQCETFV